VSGTLPRGTLPVLGPLSCACLVVEICLAHGLALGGGGGRLGAELAGGRAQVVVVWRAWSIALELVGVSRTRVQVAAALAAAASVCSPLP
jgi:hypothetical protein